MAANKVPRTFPCHISGCVRARNGSTEKVNIRWFRSKDAMVQHMNREHEIGIQFAGEGSAENKSDGKLATQTLVYHKTKSCSIKPNMRSIPYLPLLSPPARKNLPYLPPLTPTYPTYGKNFNLPYLDALSKEKSVSTRKTNTSFSLNDVSSQATKSCSARTTYSTDIPYPPAKTSKWSALSNKTIETKNHLGFSYICAFCNMLSSEKGQMHAHIWDMHFEEENRYIRCLHCPHCSETLQDLSWHVEGHHLLSGTTCPEKGYCVYCLKCLNRFDNLETFKLHIDRFQCKYEETQLHFSENLKNEGSENKCNNSAEENGNKKFQRILDHNHENDDESRLLNYQLNKGLKSEIFEGLKYSTAARNERDIRSLKDSYQRRTKSKIRINSVKKNISGLFNYKKKDFYYMSVPKTTKQFKEQKTKNKRTFWEKYC